MSTKKGFVVFDWTELDFSAKLHYLLLLLQNLPAAIPTGSRAYKFHKPIVGRQDGPVTGSQREAVLKYLEETFGRLETDDSNSFIVFKERGPGLDAVVEVLQANITDDPDESNLTMRSWVGHLLASATRAYKEHNAALPALKRIPKPKVPADLGGPKGPVASAVTPNPSSAATTTAKRPAEDGATETIRKRLKAVPSTVLSSDEDDVAPVRAVSARGKTRHVESDDSDIEMLDEAPATASMATKTPVAAKAAGAVASIFLQQPLKMAEKSHAVEKPADDALDGPAELLDQPPAPKAKAVKAAKKDKSRARVWLWDPDDLTNLEEPKPKNVTGKKTGRPPIEVVSALIIPCRSRKTGAKRWRCSQGQCRESFSSRQKERVLPHHIDDCDYVDADLREEAMALMGNAALSSQLDEVGGKVVAGTSGPTAGSSSRQSTLTELATMGGKEVAQKRFNLAVVKLFAAGGLAARLLDREEWKIMVKSANARLDTFSSTTLTETYMPQEAIRVRLISEQTLKALDNLTLSYDGGTNKIIQSVYTVHVTAPETRHAHFMLGHEASGLSHDANYIFDIAMKVMKRIGVEKFVCVVSDSTGNTRKARELLEKASGILIGLADAPHHINLTLKDICALKHFELAISQSRILLRYFSISSFGTQRLQSQAQVNGVTRGLESIGKTRFASVNRAGASILRNLPSIKELVNANVIFTSSKERQTYGFLRGHSQYNIYHATLSQLVGILTPLAKAQKCLESSHVHPGHVLLFWLAALATLQDLFDNNNETLELPQPVLQQVVAIINGRFAEMFDGEKNTVFKAALFLDPEYVRSPFWRKVGHVYTATETNPDDDLRTSIPYYFDIGNFLLQLLLKHIEAGHVDFLKKTPPKELTRALRIQLPAYTRQEFPFNRDCTAGWRSYWSNLSTHPDAAVLAFLAEKLLSMVPNSMAEERTMSAMTRAQAGRPQLHIRSLVSEVQVKQHNDREEQQKKPQVPTPSLHRFRELSARVRAEVMSSAEDRFVHPKSTGAISDSASAAPDAPCHSGLKASTAEAFGTEFNELEAHEPVIGELEDLASIGFDVRDSINLSAVLLRDLLSDKPLSDVAEGTSTKASAVGSHTEVGDFTLDEADFKF